MVVKTFEILSNLILSVLAKDLASNVSARSFAEYRSG